MLMNVLNYDYNYDHDYDGVASGAELGPKCANTRKEALD